jgi:Domain of unknown function (DUF4397)
MRIPSSARRAIATMALPVVLLGVAGGASASAATTGNAATTGKGWVRLAHLSPNTPAVDVYLYSFGNSSAERVLRHVGYGAVSPYQGLAVGDYTVAMRAAGAAPTTKPVLSASLAVAAGHAYTVAGLGPESGLRLQVLADQLTTPSGQALVRVVQASLRQHVVTVTYGGSPVASGLAFASVSSYQAVDPATAAVRIAGDGETASSTVALAAGTVHTLVVLDGARGLEVDNIVDAAGSAVMPAGAAGTGLGGTAPHLPSPLPWLVLIGAGSLAAVAGGLRLRRLARTGA